MHEGALIKMIECRTFESLSDMSLFKGSRCIQNILKWCNFQMWHGGVIWSRVPQWLAMPMVWMILQFCKQKNHRKLVPPKLAWQCLCALMFMHDRKTYMCIRPCVCKKLLDWGLRYFKLLCSHQSFSFPRWYSWWLGWCLDDLWTI